MGIMEGGEWIKANQEVESDLPLDPRYRRDHLRFHPMAGLLSETFLYGQQALSPRKGIVSLKSLQDFQGWG